MIRHTTAETLPTGAIDILLALEHLPGEDDLAFGLESARYLILNRGHWELITQDQLPIVANPDVLQLGQLSRLTRDSEADTLTEAVTEAVRELLAEQDVCTRYVHELDKDGLLKEATKTSRFRRVDTAGELLRYVYLPELKRRDLNTEALEIGQNFFWRVVDVAAWSLPVDAMWLLPVDVALCSLPYNPQEAFDTFTSKERVNNLFYRAIKCVREGLDNCDNSTLLGEVTRERATNIIDLAVWEDDDFDLELLRDAVALAKESTELDSNPELNILQEGHQDLCERFDCSGWLWRWRSRNCRDYTVTHLKRFIELSEKRAGHSGSYWRILSLRRLRIWFDRDPDLLVAMLQVR